LEKFLFQKGITYCLIPEVVSKCLKSFTVAIVTGICDIASASRFA